MDTLRILAAVALAWPLHAYAGAVSEQHPDVVLCAFSGTETTPAGDAVLYIAGVGDDGSVVYQSLGRNVITAIFDADGAPSGPSENVCGGLSLAELQAGGKTRDLAVAN